MKKILFLAAVTMLSAISCNDKLQNDVYQDDFMSFNASVEGVTRTVIDGMKSYWDGTEGIRVLDGTVSKVFEAEVTKAQTATFVEKDQTVRLSGDDYLAVYPEGPAGSVTWNGEDADPVKKFWLPGDQKAVINSYDPSTHIAMAYAKAGDNNLEFKNVNALVKVTVANDDVSEICFYGNSGEVLTGNFDVNYNVGNPEISVPDANDYTKNAYAKITGNIENGATYYISIFPCVFKAGFSVEFIIDGVKYTKKLNSEYTVLRNQIIDLPVVEFVPEVVAKKDVYMRPTADWNSNNGKYVAWTWGGSISGAWYDLEDVDGDGIYKMSVPVECGSAIFLCMKAGATTDWKNEIARSSELTLPSDDKNCYNLYTSQWGTLDEVKAYDPGVILPKEGCVYLKPNTNWLSDGARFAIYLCNGSKGEKWLSMAKVEGTSYYEVQLPTDFSVENYKNIIFCRMNGSTTANNWENKWNQSGDLLTSKITEGNNCCAIASGQWDCGTNVTWSNLTRLN